MGSGAEPKIWVLEELLAEGQTSVELIQACRIPNQVLEDAPLILKQRFALHLLADVLQRGRVPGAVLQLVNLLTTPPLGWEGDTDALIAAVKIQACLDILKGEEGAARRNWKGFANCVAELFGIQADQSDASKGAHEALSTVLQPVAKKQREAALEKLVENHPLENVLKGLKQLYEAAKSHMPSETTLKRLEAKQYIPQPPPPAVLPVAGLANGTSADGHGFEGPSDLPEGEDMDLDGAAGPSAVKLGPRRKVTEKRPFEFLDSPEGAFSSPEQGPPKKGRGKRKRAILSDEEGGTPGTELALIDSALKRGPGRPRIHPKPDPDAPKRPRGRPRVYENGAPPRSPLRRRKSAGAKVMVASPDQNSALRGGPDQASPFRGGQNAPGGATPVGLKMEEEEEEEETTPLKRRRVVADKGVEGSGGAVGGARVLPQVDNVNFSPTQDGANALPPDHPMDGPLSPPEPQTQPGGGPPSGELHAPPAAEGARRTGLRLLEELDKAGRAGGDDVDFEMPELGPEEGGGAGNAAALLTMTEDGSNDWCCLCQARLEEVGALLLCTGCPNATCYECAGVSETPPLEYICPTCLGNLKKKREKAIRAKMEVTRKQTQDASPAPAPPPQAIPVARVVEHSDPGPSTEPAPRARIPPSKEGNPEPGEPVDQPEKAPELEIPGQEAMPELPEDVPGAPKEEGAEGQQEGEGKEKEAKKERTKTEEGRRSNRYWSEQEVAILKEAMELYVKEENKHRIPWELIRTYGLRHGVFDGRSGVDLKDKWRNMKRAEEKAALA